MSPRSDPVLDRLLAEAEAAPVDGWDFSWLEGRAWEARPPWGYVRLLTRRLASAATVLDVQTGGGEVLAEALRSGCPPVVRATESWPPNLERARQTLAPFGCLVSEAAEEGPLPFPSESFDLVVSRHPTTVVWPEVARVLRPGGTYLSQQVGPASNRELTEFMMGPQTPGDRRSPRRAESEARAAGLEVVDRREATLDVSFGDVGAVAYFLRKVVWTVPGFTIDAYRDRLAALHEEIERSGAFLCHSRRFLIEARKPTGG